MSENGVVLRLSVFGNEGGDSGRFHVQTVMTASDPFGDIGWEGYWMAEISHIQVREPLS